MRVAFVANWWYRRGGLGGVMLDEAAALEELGHVVLPFASAHPDNLPASTSDFFPRFLETSDLARGVALGKRLQAAADVVWNRSAATAFARFLDECAPDVIHLHNTVRQLSPSILESARTRRIPVLMTLHDYGLICPQGLLLKGGIQPCAAPNCERGVVMHAVANRCVKGSILGSSVAAVEHLIHRALNLYAGRIRTLVTPTQFLADRVRAARISVSDIRILPNGLKDVPAPPPLPGSGGHILYHGRLVAEKGIDVLLAAAAGLPEIPFVVVGDGPLRGRLEGMAPPNVRLVGHQSTDQLEHLRTDAVAIASPSTWYENAPLAVLEAMRAGRPVIATDIGGQPELLSRGGGLLINPGDVPQLDRAVRRLWADRDEARRLGQAGREAFVQEFAFEHHMRRLLALYAEAVTPPSRASTVAAR